jgi:hypothetical protein
VTGPIDRVRVVVWAVVALLALAVAGYAAGLFREGDRAALAPTVYGGPVAENGRLACTAQGLDVRFVTWVCTGWTIVQPGQTVAPAIDPGGPCARRHVDQATRLWVCDDTVPPDPRSLPASPPRPSGPLA